MRSSILTAAIAVALSAISFNAVAAPHKTHRHKTTSVETVSRATIADSQAAAITQRDAEIAELKTQMANLEAKVASLDERTDAQSDINVGTQQNVEKLQANESKVDKLDKLVNNTKIGGTAFINTTDISHKERGPVGSLDKKDGHGSVNGPGIDVKRFYLTIDHQFNDIYSASLTADFNFISADAETQLFVKKAFVQAKFSPLFAVRLGAADMPWIPFSEKWYSYRFLENTLIDRSIGGGSNAARTGEGSFGNSSDWGVHAFGGTTGDNSVNYQVSVVNGRGFKNPSRSKGVDVEGRFAYQPIDSVVIAVGGYSGKRGQDVQNGLPTQNATRGDVLVAFRNDTVGVGAEYFTAKNWDDVLKYTGAAPGPLGVKDNANGWSLWGDWKFQPQWAVFARYDNIDSKYTNLLGAQGKIKDTYYNAGVSYDILKNLKLALAYKHDDVQSDGRFQYKTDEFGFWGLLTY